MGARSLPPPRTADLAAATRVRVPPVARHVIPRPRLEQLPVWSAGELTAVIAGPGRGKTVAVRQHALARQQDGAAVAWLSIDPFDDHPNRFWLRLVEALRVAGRGAGLGDGRRGGAGDDPGGHDPAGGDDSPTGGRHGPATAAAHLRRLAGSGRPVLVVLDDVHHLHDPTVLHQLAHLVGRRPGSVQVVAAMRTEPAMPASSWRCGPPVGTIRAHDLRLDDDEGAEVLRRLPGVDLDDPHRRRLVRRLDGWPALVVLSALALRAHPDAAGFVDRRLAADRLVIDHLIGQAVDAVDPDQRRFLFALSVLDHFDASLAAEVTGAPDAAARLDRLDDDGCFLSARDPDRTIFAFHPAVADLLHHELRWRGGEALSDAHRHAATVLARRGQLERATVHTLQAGDPVGALRRTRAVDQYGPATAPTIPAATAVTVSTLVGPASGRRGDGLSSRETALLALLPTHLNYREMAAELYVSVNTVKTQVKSVYRKLGVGSRAEAVQVARRLGLLD